MIDGGEPAPELLALARHVINGHIAQARGRLPDSRRGIPNSSRRPERPALSRAPYGYYPVRQSLGAALLQQAKAREAEPIFKEALEEFSNNALALHGLREPSKAQGAAAQVNNRLSAAWAGEPANLSLSRL
jgi:hypothetical protein